jgi:hypothetical protein
VNSDRVSSAAAELYAADLDEFMQRRKALAAAARDAGDKDAAKRIGALRKPTRPAWVVNRLARADPGAADRLADLAAGLREAARAKDGRKLRALSTRRDELIDDLTGQAFTAAGISDPPAGLREDVVGTLTAALADPEVAGQFAAGALTRAAQWAGFGLAPADEDEDEDEDADAADESDAEAAGEVAPEADDAAADDAADDDAAADGRVQAKATPAKAEPAKAEPAKAEPRREARAKAAAKAPARPSPRRRSPAPRRAQAPDEAAAKRREAHEDAERSLAAALKAAAAAGAAEDQLEATVRDLEGRLTKARAELSDARLRARRAEAAERKARQALDRSPRPE